MNSHSGSGRRLLGPLSTGIHGVFRLLGNAFKSSLVIICLVRAGTIEAAEPALVRTNELNRTETIVLPRSVPDPIEPVNRAVYGFNRALMTGFVKPTAKVYRVIVIKPVRTGIANFGRNITFPGRLINNLLQGKWNGARDEAYRFGCNTTVGLAGFIDVASKWKIPKSDADFGQTFGQWGWKPKVYLMLPIFGPSNERDTVGMAADTAADPLTYVSPYKFDAHKPLTYLSPYTYVSYTIVYNNLSDSVDDYVRFARSEMDSYSLIQYAWTFVRQNRVADFQVEGPPDPATLETLESVFFTFQNSKFPDRGKTRSVRIPSTGRDLKFTTWLQPKRAPVVYIIPGLGSHRLATTALALAELVYREGFSAVCVSSTFNFEFMENASTADLPAYMPVDVQDLQNALGEIDERLRKDYPARLGPRALMGYSMGGFQSLFLAATQSTNNAAKLHFDRYVAINTPVRLLHGISTLDDYYNAPLAWPEAERTDRIENTFLKVAALSKNSLTPQASLPFSETEAKFLIGTAFRVILRDAIYSSQQRKNRGVLAHPINKWRRAPLYDEILRYSYGDYLRRFLTPYYWSRGVELDAPESLENASSLQPYSSHLKTNANIRVVVNRNDPLLADEDLAWLSSTIPPERLTMFERGGHLGNLSHPAVKQAIVDAFRGLRETNESDASSPGDPE